VRTAFLIVAPVAFWACTEPRQTNNSTGQGDPIDTKIKRNLQAEPDTPKINVKVKRDEAKPAERAETAKAGKSDENSSQASPASSTDLAQGATK